MSTSAFHSTQASARRWLQLAAAACLTALLVACGGGGGSPASSIDGGAPGNLPWKALYAAGGNTFTLNGTGCTTNLIGGTLSSVALTFTQGTDSLRISALLTSSEGTATFGPVVLGSGDSFGLAVSSNATATFEVSASSFADGVSTYFNLYSNTYDDGSPNQNFSMARYLGDSIGSFNCNDVANPLLRSAFPTFSPAGRISSFISGITDTQALSTPAEGCQYAPNLSFSITPAGQITVTGELLAANWFETSGSYSELTNLGPNSSSIMIYPNANYDYIVLYRSNVDPSPAGFSITCGNND
jgi:hypothetical protein